MTARSILALCVLALSGCTCAAETSSLGGDSGAIDGGSIDGGSIDGGSIDTGVNACARASECPGPFSPCDDPASCGCGTFKSCRGGRCLAFSIDCRSDGGLIDAGQLLDAGATPDGAVPCQRAADCAGPILPMAQVCPGSSHSCIDGVCIWECQPQARTCTGSPSDCQRCDGAELCPETNCGIPSGSVVNRVEEATPGCALIPGTNRPFAGSPVRLFPTARPCSLGVELDNQFIGFMLRFKDQQAFASLQDFGGTCTVTEAPTGAIRFIFSCPACQFVLGP